MAMLSGFFDAAGDNRSPDAITVGGYMAPVRNWSKFSKDWRGILNVEDLGDFHMTDFMAGEGDFAAWKDQPDRQMKLLRKLAKVVGRYVHFCPASTIILKDWHALNDKYRLKECHATPYAIASISVINKSIQWLKLDHPHDALTQFVFEAGDNGYGDLMFFMEHVRRRAKELNGIYPQFQPKSLEPLQACDFVAWEQRYVIKKKLANEYDHVRDSLRDLMKLKNDWGISTPQTLEDWIKFLDVPERSRPMTRREVGKWRPKPLRHERSKRGGQA